jgi:hypothetical protein
MKHRNKLISGFFMTVVGFGCFQNANAETIVLDFEGVGSGAAVNNFYNGGTDSSGRSGNNFGISFSNQSLGSIDRDAGGGGNFANEPSPNTALFFLSGGAATLNIAAGFDTGFSFFYSSAGSGFVNVYDGLNGTGNLLTTINLGRNIDSCSGDPTGEFCRFDPIGVNFSGIGRSIDFGGTANQIGFDNVTFGSATAGGSTGAGDVPEPATTALLGLGFLSFFAFQRKKDV